MRNLSLWLVTTLPQQSVRLLEHVSTVTFVGQAQRLLTSCILHRTQVSQYSTEAGVIVLRGQPVRLGLG
jgi:hypothetical protein